MSEQRLIDANMFEVYSSKVPEKHRGQAIAYIDGACSVLEKIDETPTIDPETLPIVRELQEKLKRVTAERDAAIEDLRLFGHKCNCCKHFDRPFTCIAPEPCGVNDNWEWRGHVAENATTDT